MTRHLDRREFIQLAGLTTAGIAGVVFSSGLRGVSLAAAKGKGEDFMFLQMSDLHWGFTGPAVNPDAEVTLEGTETRLALFRCTQMVLWPK